MISRLFLLLSIVFILINCRSVPRTYHPVRNTTASAGQDSLLMLAFRIQSDSSGKSTITLLSKTKVPGKLKSADGSLSSTDVIIVQQLSGSLQVLSTSNVGNPLYKSLEYTNTQNEMMRKTTNLQEAEFFVRLALVPSAVYLMLEIKRENIIVTSARFQIK